VYSAASENLEAEIDLSKEVMSGTNATEVFMTASSPGQIAC